MQLEQKISDYLRRSIIANIRSISIIGSYTLERQLLNGSDIDIVVVVDNLSEAKLQFNTIFYKMTKVIDSQGERIELNTKLDKIVLDVTIIDHFNKPNNPLTDWYENHIGWCRSAICIHGVPMTELFQIEELVQEYDSLRPKRLALVEEKIAMTEEKIRSQARRDLHIIYELQTYIFIREIMRRRIFNRQSIKHPEDAISDFDEIFRKELSEKCNLSINITNL